MTFDKATFHLLDFGGDSSKLHRKLQYHKKKKRKDLKLIGYKYN